MYRASPSTQAQVAEQNYDRILYRRCFQSMKRLYVISLAKRQAVELRTRFIQLKDMLTVWNIVAEMKTYDNEEKITAAALVVRAATIPFFD